jgi:hypothetical protein
LRLLAAWAPRAFVELIEARLARAIEELPKLLEDADPTMSRPVVTGALVLRELTACMLEREVVEALLDANSKLTRRLAVVALFAAPEVGSERVERGLAAHVAPEDIVWALLMPRRDGYAFSEEERQDMLARLIAQIDGPRVKIVLRNAGFAVAKQIGDRLAAERPALAAEAYAMVHELFEEKLHAGDLEHHYVGHAELEHLDLARSAVRHLNALGAVDLAAHIEAVVRKAGSRTRGFFRPRERILNYRSWIGGVRLMQLSALYFVLVCEGLELSKREREHLRQVAEDLVPFLEASPWLAERDDEHAVARGSARARTVNLDHALPEVLALRARLAGQG